ncbi:MAG: AraC family transcriptional regulator, partial [Proteobacteria bacterium]
QWSEVGEHCTTQQQKFIELFTDLLSSAKAVQRFDVGIPQTGALLDVAMQLIAEPNNGNNLDEWAARAKMSRRTFSRAFRDATGDSFLQWRLRLKIAISMKRLACGEDVKSISYDLGFRHASHFSSEFKSQTGMCPRQFAADPHVWNVSLDLPAPSKGPLDAVRGEDIYSSI